MSLVPETEEVIDQQQQALKEHLKALIDNNVVWAADYNYNEGDVANVKINFTPNKD